MLHHAIGAMLGAREDERAIDLGRAQGQGQQRLLLGLVDEGHLLLDPLGGGRRRGDRNLDRVGQEAVAQIGDRLGHGRREEQRLALLRQQIVDPLERMDEAQVEHLVGLVEDEDLDVAQGQRALVDQVEQAARRGDEHVDPGGERTDLARDRHAAEHGHDAELEELAIGGEALGNLAGQLAGRGEHQHAAALDRARLGVVRHVMERGEGEGGGLAGAGLRDAAQIAAVEQGRDRLRLDRGGILVPLGGERLLERRGEAEIGKFGH